MKKIIFLFLTSFLVLLFTTKYSFIYPFNDWLDANSFLTVARSVLDGKILYKDIIEQKGPILYLIYIIGHITTTKYVSGIFILEVISLTIVLYYTDKIIRIFKDYKFSYLILPIFAVLLCTSNAFVHGGSAEEFSLCFIVIGIYYFLYHLKVKNLSYKQIAINGLVAAIVSMIKFNLIGLWFGFMAFIFFDYILKKDYKRAILSCISFLIAMFATLFIILLYFIYNNAIGDFIYSYFTINVGSYTKDSSNVIIRLLKAFEIGFKNVFYNKIYLVLLPFLIFAIIKLFKNKSQRIAIVCIILTSFLGIYIGLRSYKYYSLPILVFYILLFAYLIYKYHNVIDKIINYKYRYIILSIYIILIAILSYSFANYKDYIGTKKQDYEQYKIASIIKKDMNDNTTILNYRALDYGIYNILDIIPNCKYFHKMNISYEKLPDNYDVQNEYVKKGLVDYVIIGLDEKEDDISDIEGLDTNYDLIYTSYQKYEKHKIHFYLFKLKTVL